ncbi:glycosyltransferase family 4 protein [Rhizobium sp. CG5]|uniref:glycosyltransferase family 4 protein n=1 Tax=Rhizobium sp. CG5 TaxID=2726076 RepID=UPI002034656F|nr:glycosyltransferase family 4 protein [Rhizobium sp. CG5]
MVAPNARGGMRSVVEAYERDGFLQQEDMRVIHSYDEGSFSKRQIIFLKALSSYIRLLATQKVELVHIHAAMRGSFWRKAIFSTIGRLFGRPVVLHLHGSEMKPFYASQKPFAQRLIRHQLEKANSVIVLSQSWADFVGGIAPAAKIDVLPNYVRVPTVATGDEKPVVNVLFLGLVGTRKGTYDLIEAFAKVHARHPDAKLIIGGNGETERAQQAIDGLKLRDVVTLAGWVDEQGKKVLLASSSIYVLPSYNEGLPVSVLEAMAAGLATITTRVGGIPELITDGVDGLLIDPGDIDGLAERISSLIADPHRRKELGDAGQKRIADAYSDQIILPRLHAIYEHVKSS